MNEMVALPRPAAPRRRATLAVLAVLLGFVGCGSAPGASNEQARGAAQVRAAPAVATADPARAPRRKLATGNSDPLLDDVQARTFRFFWERANAENGLIPDRWPSPSFSSVAAVGFALTAYPIGVERGFVTRAQARARVLTTLTFFANAPQGPASTGMTGYHGFFYHFLDMNSGARFAADVELSTVDTAIFLAGALASRAYFDGPDPDEVAIRARVDEIYGRVDWTWAQPRPPLITMGWYPERGFHHLDWTGYNEAMIVYILALGSPTHPIDASAWPAYTSTYTWCDFYGQQHVTFGPLFGHEFEHVWLDLRGIQDAYMRVKGIDYFENSRRAVLAQRAYAIANPGGWTGYGENIWGFTACDGPADGTFQVGGRDRTFITYGARAVGCSELRDDGTIAPYAAISSVTFAPEFAVPAAHEMARRFGDNLYTTYGFLDSFNETFTLAGREKMGRVVPGIGWIDGDYLGLDQGPIVTMIENWRNGLVLRLMRRNAPIVTGLRRAGFSGGWLDQTAAPEATAPSAR